MIGYAVGLLENCLMNNSILGSIIRILCLPLTLKWVEEFSILLVKIKT